MNPRYGNLEERCKNFATDIRYFSKQVKLNISNFDDMKQVIRSSGSIGANYMEANNSLGSKDFLMRIRICKKEAQESYYWLAILTKNIEVEMGENSKHLANEAMELARIFGAIIQKYKNNTK